MESGYISIDNNIFQTLLAISADEQIGTTDEQNYRYCPADNVFLTGVTAS